MSVSFECCVLSLRQVVHSPRRVVPSVVCVCEDGREASTVRRPWPIRVCFAIEVMYNKSTDENEVREIIYKNLVIVSRTTHGAIIAKLIS
jgi:hypothetical protein